MLETNESSNYGLEHIVLLYRFFCLLQQAQIAPLLARNLLYRVCHCGQCNVLKE